jgi:SAM-dependent methyltransferase
VGDPRDPNLATYYADARHLRERQGGTRPGAPGGEFADWVLNLVDPSRFTAVLDAGAGVGRFTVRLVERARPGTVITAVDLFPSMVQELRGLPSRVDVELRVIQADIARLPFARASFDLVMANHVLYHVPDLPGVLERLAGLLAAGGVFVATTNADTAAIPVLTLHTAVCRGLGVAETPDVSAFSSETAGPILQAAFANVIEHTFTRPATVTTPADLLRSYRSTGRYQLLCRDHSPSLVEQIADAITTEWANQSQALTGDVRMSAFICRDISPTSAIAARIAAEHEAF